MPLLEAEEIGYIETHGNPKNGHAAYGTKYYLAWALKYGNGSRQKISGKRAAGVVNDSV